MIKAHKIRLHPTPEQANYFARAAGTARFTFNWALAEWKRQYEAGEKLSALALKKQFNAIRTEQFPWSYEVTKCAIEGAFMDVAAAFKNFFEGRKAGRKTGYPRFKSKKKSHQSFYLANDKFTVGDHWIDVPKLGRVNMAEQLRFAGKILSARISKTADWWFVSITVEMPDGMPENHYPPVGIDVGLNRLATLSDGTRYENQRPLRHLLKKLRRMNKELARRTKGGKNRQKTKSKLARLHYRIACSFSDAALGKPLDLLESKVPRAGGVLVKVDRFFPSSQLCHRCDWRWEDIILADRLFICQNPACQNMCDRDVNAAINILHEALRLVGLRDEVVPIVATAAPKSPGDLG